MSGFGGAEGTRTPDFFLAKEALSQLSYSPTSECAANANAQHLAAHTAATEAVSAPHAFGGKLNVQCAAMLTTTR